MDSHLFVWLMPTLAATLFWGVAQGLVKKYIGEVPPARFCLYYAVANAIVNVLFWASQDAPPILAPEGRMFLMLGLLAYVLDGIAWIFYYQSIVYGPISIVGTLSAAYPALTVIFAHLFLGETLTAFQAVGVVGVIAGCLGLAYSPPDASRRPTLGTYGILFGRKGALSGKEWSRAFLPMATMALGGLMVAIAYKHGPASIVTPLSGAYPVVTLAFAWAVPKERPTALHWCAIAAILVGFVFTTMVAG